MKKVLMRWLIVVMFVCLPVIAQAQCSNSPTPTASATPTVTATATPNSTPFPNAWLRVSPTSIGPSDGWLIDPSMSGYYEKYLVTLNKAPFAVTFTDSFTGDDPTAFTAVFTTCMVNSDGSITVAENHGCAWWILTDDFGVDAVYVATSVPVSGQIDPGSPYSVPVAH